MSNATMDIQLPHKLNKYQIIELIANGGYGSVYRAVDTRGGQAVVIKLGNEKDIKRGCFSLNNEIEHLQRLQHENIVRLVDFSKFSASGKGQQALTNAMLVLEDCVCDLKTLLLVCPRLGSQEIKTIAKHIFCSLAYLEECQIIHWDIKPNNILLSSDGKMKLCDFGSAKSFGNNEVRGNFTICYAPMEILLGVSNIGYTADAWSAGCVITELHIGKFLFPKATKREQITAIFNLCGTFTPESWLSLVPFLPQKYKEKRLKYKTGALNSWLQKSVEDSMARNLLSHLLVTDSKRRWTSKAALQSPYICSIPYDVIPTLQNLVKTVQNKLMSSAEESPQDIKI